MCAMSVSTTTLTLGPIVSADNLQRAQLYQSHQSVVGLGIGSKVNHHHYSNSNNNKNTSSTSCYQFPTLDAAVEQFTSMVHGYNPLPTTTEDPQLSLERSQSTAAALSASASASPATALLLHKSSSCNAMLKAKATILIQDSANGRVNTSLTDSEGDYGATFVGDLSSGGGGGGVAGSVSNNNNVGSGSALDICTEQDAFLPPVTGGVANGNSNNNSLASSSRSRGSRSHGKSKASICYRAHAFITRNWYLSYLVPLSILLALMFVAYLTRDYARRLLFWIETQNPWVIFAMFMLFFVVVSFPVVVGYFVLMITSGYLFGFFKGFLTVILGANVGIAIAHVTMRSLRHRIPMHKIIKNETGRAILRVISGPRAFRVVLFTRLTPIPFGIQNAIFGVSSINPRIYHTATFLGLLPAQTINVYLGSTLRSMHEVLNNHGTALTGYISFAVEVVCGVALMFWVVQKARKELSDTLLSDISTEGKLIDIQV